VQENYVLVLPHLVKISEMCDNADQFKWIKSTMMALRETVPMENTISHQVTATTKHTFIHLVIFLAYLGVLATLQHIFSQFGGFFFVAWE
jgi:hypothetical protein